MKRNVTAALVFAMISAASAVAAGTEAMGWRGDGTGRFPDADPPVKWARTSRTIADLRNSAEKIEEAGPGEAETVEQGTIREWLILGPVAADDEVKMKDLVDREQLEGEALLQPKEGDRAGGVAWRKIETTGSMLLFNRHLEGLKGKAVYACTYLYSPRARRVLLHLGMAAGKVWVNGERHVSQQRFQQANSTLTARLKKGRNTLLVKTFGARKDTDYGGTKAGDAYLKLTLYGAEKGETFETEGILWRAHPPQAGVGGKQHFSCYQPVVVGDKVFVASDPGFLVCYDKKTGKRLWMRDTTAYDFVTAEERKANPESFAKIDLAQKRFREIAYSYKGSLQERAEMYRFNDEIRGSLRKVNKDKYHYDTKQEAGNAAQPASDGRFVYVWYHNNIAACFDLEGKRIWKAYEHDEGPHKRHGYKKSVILIGGDVAVEVKKNIIGFDRKTGKVNWRIPFKFNTYSNYNLNDRERSEETGIVSFRDLGLHKPGVGFVPWLTTTRSGDRLYGGGNEQGVLVRLQMTGEGGAPFEIKRVRSGGTGPRPILTPGTNWSPAVGAAYFLIHDGLIYTMGFGGVLRVFDSETLARVYERQLDFVPVTYAYPYPYGAGVCASPTLGGKYVYLWGATGTTIVIEPGREFKQVAMNRIESAIEGDLYKWRDHFRAGHYYPECTVSSPIFDGRRIYYRAEEYVYCIGRPERAAEAMPAAASPSHGPRRAARPRREAKPMTDEQKANGLLSIARNYVRAEMRGRAEKKTAREMLEGLRVEG